MWNLIRIVFSKALSWKWIPYSTAVCWKSRPNNYGKGNMDDFCYILPHLQNYKTDSNVIFRKVEGQMKHIYNNKPFNWYNKIFYCCLNFLDSSIFPLRFSIGILYRNWTNTIHYIPKDLVAQKRVHELVTSQTHSPLCPFKSQNMRSSTKFWFIVTICC